jgi:hypothetical protein
MIPKLKARKQMKVTAEIFSFFLFLWLNLHQECHLEVSSSSFPVDFQWDNNTKDPASGIG